MTSWDNFSRAAIDYCRQDNIIRDLKRQLQRCTRACSPDYSIGDPGVGPCYCDVPAPDPKDMCDACRTRVTNKPAYMLALRGRSRAKRRMIKWFPKLGEAVSE